MAKFKMRISIREQLGFLVLLSALIGIAVVAIATWITNHNFVMDIRSTRLSLTASLKAAQLTSNLALMQSTVRSASTRLLIQSALIRYYNGNNTDANWSRSITDLTAALQGGQAALLLQAQVTPSDPSGPAGENPVINATADSLSELHIKLPYNYPDGSAVELGDGTPESFPPALYPNLTYHPIKINSTYTQSSANFNGEVLNEASVVLLGPYQLNTTFSLISLTMPIINNTSAIEILGWLTVVLDGRLISDVLDAQEGLDQSGIAMLVGPTNVTNQFAPGVLWQNNDGKPPEHLQVRFVVPVEDPHGRHTGHNASYNPSFDHDIFEAVKEGLTKKHDTVNNAGSLISTKNEQGANVAIGFAMPNTQLVNWLILVEQSHSEVWKPIDRLRNLLLACVFGTAGAVMLLALPVAHYSSAQVRRLRDATRKTVVPPGYIPDSDSHGGSRNFSPENEMDHEGQQIARKEGFFAAGLARLRPTPKLTMAERREAAKRRQFSIPSKVKETKHLIQDELTELTTVFNEMCDELYVNYERLEEKVRERTAELELAKQAAEAANRSKTLFIANISHELKTPLNGILNYAAEAMIEENPEELRENAGFIYRSGQILLNLVQDVLTFAQNQSTQLSIVEQEFKLRHVISNVKALFRHPAREAGIDLDFYYEGPAVEGVDEDGEPTTIMTWFGPNASGRIKDMILWGDSQRIGQVLINLVSNALKFTPQGGRVKVTVRCIEELHTIPDNSSRRSSAYSRQTSARNSVRNSGRNSRTRSRMDSASNASQMTPTKLDTANEINALEKPKVVTRVVESDRSSTPPPGRLMLFEFEVSDTGPGVAPEMQERIFEPFVQGDLSLSKKHAGTGLGLSICSQLARAMDGNISLHSDGKTGSTFNMQIPIRYLTTKPNSKASSTGGGTSEERRNSTQSERVRTPVKEYDPAHVSFSEPGTPTQKPTQFSDAPARLVGLTTPFYVSNAQSERPSVQKAEAAQVVNEASSRMGKMRILVAEDNEMNVKVVRKLVARYERDEDVPQGVELVVATNGVLAVDAVRQSLSPGNRPFDLIFMDIQMPYMDGIQATKEIRALGFSYPIIGLSAGTSEQADACIAAGMNHFVPKPIDREKLKKVVKTFYVPTTIPEVDETPLPSPTPGTRSNSDQKLGTLSSNGYGSSSSTVL